MSSLAIPRPVGTFVYTMQLEEDLVCRGKVVETWWVEKVTGQTSVGAEIRTRWCEAVSERKAYLISVALNSMVPAGG